MPGMWSESNPCRPLVAAECPHGRQPRCSFLFPPTLLFTLLSEVCSPFCLFTLLFILLFTLLSYVMFTLLFTFLPFPSYQAARRDLSQVHLRLSVLYCSGRRAP